MLRRLGPFGPLFRLGCFPSASPAPLLEGGRQDLLGLGAEATCKAQWDSLLLCHSLACRLPPRTGSHSSWPVSESPSPNSVAPSHSPRPS